MEKEAGQNYGKLLQLYGVHKAIREAKRKGHLVQRRQQENGAIKLIIAADLPNQAEREAIWRIQIAKYQRDPKNFDIVQLSKATEGLAGSEIEAVIIESLYQAFGDDQEPTDLMIPRR